MNHFSASNSADHDIVVTGFGLVTPLGLNRNESWRQLQTGETAARVLDANQIDHFDGLQALLRRAPIGAPVDHAEVRRRVTAGCPPEIVNRFGHDELNNLILLSAQEAMDQAAFQPGDIDPKRLGCCVGTSKASLRAMERWTAQSSAQQVAERERFRNAVLPDAPLRAVAAMAGAAGPISCPVAACATGLIAVLQAARAIQSGHCDICLAGSADASLRASVLASFHRLGVTSKATDAATACRPFDRQRDGFIVGEGAAAFVLESRASAERRGAKPLGIIEGGAWCTDPTGITQIDATGGAVRQVVERVLQHQPQTPDFCSVHGTATETNDLAESRGLQSALNGSIPCFGVKGATGHLLGAAGSVELGFTLLSLQHGQIPATTGLQQIDPTCPIDVARESRTTSGTTALKLSLGFGGHVAACLVRKDEDG